MIDIARQDDVVVEAEFNGVELKAYSTSDAVNVINEYYRKMSEKSDTKKVKLKEGKTVGLVADLTGICDCDINLNKKQEPQSNKINSGFFIKNVTVASTEDGGKIYKAVSEGITLISKDGIAFYIE